MAPPNRKIYLILFSSLVFVNAAWWLYLQLEPAHDQLANYLFNLVYAFSFLLAGFLGLWAAGSSRQLLSIARISLGLFGLACLAYAAAQILWFFEAVPAIAWLSTVSPEPFYFTAQFLFCASLFLLLVFVSSRRPVSRWLQLFTLVLLPAGYILLFFLFFSPSWSDYSSEVLNGFYVATSVIFSALTFLNLIIESDLRWRGFYLLVMVGSTLSAAGDVIFSISDLKETYWNGDLSDGLYAASALALLSAVGYFLWHRPEGKSSGLSSHSMFSREIMVFLSILALSMVFGVQTARFEYSNAIVVDATAAIATDHALRAFHSVFVAGVLVAVIVFLFLSQQKNLRNQLADLTADLRKKINELSEKKYYLDSVGEAVLVVNEGNRVLYANVAARRDLAGRLPAISSEQMREIRQGLKRDKYWSGEITGSTGKNRGHVFLAAVRPLAGKSSPVAELIFVLRDITDRKQIEESKTQFVSFVAHQLREPMTQIRWSLESIQRDKRLSKATRDSLGVLENMIAFESRFINDLLNISRLERGVIEVEQKPIPLATLLAAVTAPLHQEAADRHVTLVEPDVPGNVKVLADEEKSAEAIRNIVHNALKFTRPGTKVEVGFVEEKKYAVVSVRDHGTGIPKDMQQMLFDIKSGDNFANLPKSGAGLGLYFADKFIKLVGGEITFKTSPRGTTFFVALPKARP